MPRIWKSLDEQGFVVIPVEGVLEEFMSKELRGPRKANRYVQGFFGGDGYYIVDTKKKGGWLDKESENAVLAYWENKGPAVVP